MSVSGLASGGMSEMSRKEAERNKGESKEKVIRVKIPKLKPKTIDDVFIMVKSILGEIKIAFEDIQDQLERLQPEEITKEKKVLVDCAVIPFRVQRGRGKGKYSVQTWKRKGKGGYLSAEKMAEMGLIEIPWSKYVEEIKNE